MTAEAESNYAQAGFTGLDAQVVAEPHPMYAHLRQSATPLRVDSIQGPAVIAGKRADLDEMFRHPETYSSRMHNGALGNVRPLIPIEIDPPDQRKYRKILDPLFHPQRLRALEGSVTRLVNDLIDGFGDASEIDFAAQFSVPFPSQVFLTLFGLPLAELPRFLEMKDGIIRPFHVLGKPMGDPEVRAYQVRTAGSIYD